MQILEYSERLVSFKLYSLQRRRERYCIIYVWKIFEGLVPNLCSVVRLKSKLDCYLKNIVDLPVRLGFSNSLDSGDILQW